MILEIVNHDNWEEAEIYWIKFYKDLGANLTNGTTGGNSGLKKLTQETKDKIRLSNTGKVFTDERKQNISKSKMGYKASDSTKEKLAIIGKNNINFLKELGKKQTGINNPMFGKVRRGEKRSYAKSKYIGVHWSNQRNKWRCRININNKDKHIGFFNDEILAAKAYDNYVIQNNIQSGLNFGDK